MQDIKRKSENNIAIATTDNSRCKNKGRAEHHSKYSYGNSYSALFPLVYYAITSV